MACTFKIEETFSGPVCGLDEAGRGPLAGPVVAACVYIPEEFRKEKFWKKVTDSKQLSATAREELYPLIIGCAHYGIAQSSVDEIDAINILQASLQAMNRSLSLMMKTFSTTPTMALIDGNRTPKNMPCPTQTVVKGDSLSLSIAAASILAKVTRDGLMHELCAQHPVYGWSRNAGYGTPEHLQAIQSHGITIHHRKSFAPVKSMIEQEAA